MPQMKPMNWLMLFILTNLIMMFMNIMIFFMKNYNMILKKNENNYKNNLWKW